MISGCSVCARRFREQTFPLTLDLDHPAFKAGLDRLLRIARKMEAAAAQGGLWGKIKKTAYAGAAARRSRGFI